MLGAGFACVYARSFRRNPPGLVHAAWSGAPATAAWLLWRMNGHRFTAGAHAYDVFEHGGDWWLREKLEAALFVHTSTELARLALIAAGREGGQGGMHPERPRAPAGGQAAPRLAGSAPHPLLSRLVEKKGLDRQLRIYAALKASGRRVRPRGSSATGRCWQKLEKLAGHLGVADLVTFTGQVPSHEVWEHLSWADVLLHTGVVARAATETAFPT
jgi:colanic acid/amylovoran biosynthesis glycosyltransferase